MGKLQLAASEAHEKILKERGEITFISAFVSGYEFGNWQDIAQVLTIYEQCVDDGIISRYGDYHSIMVASVEVLRRFNEQKEEKK